MGMDELKKRLRDYNGKPLFMKADRDTLLLYYVRTGKITKEEAMTYKGGLKDLPNTTRGLTIAYSLLNVYDLNRVGIEDLYDFIRTLPHSENKSPLRAIDHYDMSADEFAEACMYFNYDKRFEAAATFVGAQRRRLRAELFKMLRIMIAYELSKELPESGIDFIPYLRDMAAEKGYRAKAKSLNDKDKAAIDECTAYYLDLLELIFLNGEGEERYRLFCECPEGETYMYRDEEDEAITSYYPVYMNLEAIFYEALNGFEAQALEDCIGYVDAKCREEADINKELAETKFSVYLEG